MENSKFPTCSVISSILATCIYISAAAQNFRRDDTQGIKYANFVKNPSNRLNVAVLDSLMVYRPVDCTFQCLNNHEYRMKFFNESRIIEVKQDRNHEHPMSNDSASTPEDNSLATIRNSTLGIPAC